MVRGGEGEESIVKENVIGGRWLFGSFCFNLLFCSERKGKMFGTFLTSRVSALEQASASSWTLHQHDDQGF